MKTRGQKSILWSAVESSHSCPAPARFYLEIIPIASISRRNFHAVNAQCVTLNFCAIHHTLSMCMAALLIKDFAECLLWLKCFIIFASSRSSSIMSCLTPKKNIIISSGIIDAAVELADINCL